MPYLELHKNKIEEGSIVINAFNIITDTNHELIDIYDNISFTYGI